LCPAEHLDHITETFKGKLIFNLSYGAVFCIFLSEVSCCLEKEKKSRSYVVVAK